MNLNSVKDRERMRKNPHYEKFYQEREELKKRYDENLLTHSSGEKKAAIEFERYINSDEINQYRQYLKELTDLIFQPNGNFQHFIWDIVSEVEKEEMERKARGRYHSPHHY